MLEHELYWLELIDNEFIFQHDKCGLYRAEVVDQWFKANHIQRLTRPSSSPDLNPIENIWGILQDMLLKDKNDNLDRDDLWKSALRVWYSEIERLIPRLYRRMPIRMEEVI